MVNGGLRSTPTQTVALGRAGALYYSDEYAPLDGEGFVHPYPKPLSLRKGGGHIDHDVASLGGTAS